MPTQLTHNVKVTDTNFRPKGWALIKVDGVKLSHASIEYAGATYYHTGKSGTGTKWCPREATMEFKAALEGEDVRIWVNTALTELLED